MPLIISLIRLGGMGREDVDLEECGTRSYMVSVNRILGQDSCDSDSLIQYYLTPNDRGIERDWRPSDRYVEDEHGPVYRQVHPLKIAWMIMRYNVPCDDAFPPEFEKYRRFLGLELDEAIAAWEASPQPAVGAKRKSPGPNAKRNKWMYDQYCNHPEKTIKAIRAESGEKHRWYLGSDQAVNKAVESYCKAMGIDKPTRKSPRIKQD
jgi:hypothetical protein